MRRVFACDDAITGIAARMDSDTLKVFPDERLNINSVNQ